MKKWVIIGVIVLVIIIGIIIFAYVKEGCETDADCLTKNCFTVQCIKNNCIYSPIINCCGNERCEINETYSECAVDCPSCEDYNDCTIDKYDHHEQKCVNKPIIPCCGNEICDENVETNLDCSIDCPSCDDNNKLTGDSFNYATQECEYVKYCFFEDFDEGSVDGDLDPEWSFANGMLVALGEGAHVRFGNSSWTEYTLSFRVKLEPGMHTHVRQSLEGFYDIMLSADEMRDGIPHRISLRKELFDLPEAEDSLEAKEYPFAQNQFYDIKIELKGNNIKVYVDNNLEIDFVDKDNPILSGNINFRPYNKAYFDYVKVEGPCSE